MGKRVDYSGRSVIVVGPELAFASMRITEENGYGIIQAFHIPEVTKARIRKNDKASQTNGWNSRQKLKKNTLDTDSPDKELADVSVVWDVLDEVIKEHPVLLNRAPTLHRLGIQAFEPILSEGKAIRLHPLVLYRFQC